METADIIIIGAGVSGCAVARELARRKNRIIVLERANDICEGTSKANSGIVHAGYDAATGTLKARLNVRGNQLMEPLSEELDFPFLRNGSLVLCFEEEGLPLLEELMKRGQQNGVRGLQILTPQQVREREPNVSMEIKGALYAPSGGIVCPFGFNLALAENACENGVEFRFSHTVEQIKRLTGPSWTIVSQQGNSGYQIQAGGEVFYAPVVVNAAGVYADRIHNMVSAHSMRIIPRKGEYCLMDKEVGNLVTSTIFQLPSKLGKGILVTPTVHGNLLVGPTASDIPDKEGVNTTEKGLKHVMDMGSRSVKGLSAKKIITSFAGLRAHGSFLNGDQDEIDPGEVDFIVEEVSDALGFFDVAGIESPGLTSAPAIGEYVAELIQERYPAAMKEHFIQTRQGIPNMAQADEATRTMWIARDKAYANVVCRCELVTEGEIRSAIRRPLGATTLDGIKRRTRAGMGRCQAGFCLPRTAEILAQELQVDIGEITKRGGDSKLLSGYNKEAYWNTDNGEEVQ